MPRKKRRRWRNDPDWVRKLEDVNKCTDTNVSNLIASDYPKIFRTYYPTIGRKFNIEDLKKSDKSHHNFFANLLETIEDNPSRAIGQKQAILAIALSERNRVRAEEAEEILEIIENIAPGVIGSAKYQWLRKWIRLDNRTDEVTEGKNKRKKRTRFEYKIDCREAISKSSNWNAEHKRKELMEATALGEKVFLKKGQCPIKPSGTKAMGVY